MDRATAEAEIVFAMGPGKGVRELCLARKEVGQARLSDGERHRPTAGVSGGQIRRRPVPDGISVQVHKPRLIEHVRTDRRSQAELRGPGPASEIARNTGRVRSPDGVLRVVVVKAIRVESEHQSITRGEPLVHPGIEQRLAIVTAEIEAAIGRKYERWQRARKVSGTVLRGVIGGYEEECLVFDDGSANTN